MLIRTRPLVTFVLLPALACATAAGVARAACYAPQQQMSTAAVDQFVQSPAQILSDFPSGGAQMISRMRDLAASNPAALPALIKLVPAANTDQQTAIGTGLGQAAQICARTDQAYTTAIQQAVARSNVEEVIVAYAAVVGDRPLGGLGGGAGGGSPDGGGPINAAGAPPTAFAGTSQNFGTSSVRTSPSLFTNAPISRGTFTFNSATTNINNRITRSVSPF